MQPPTDAGFGRVMTIRMEKLSHAHVGIDI